MPTTAKQATSTGEALRQASRILDLDDAKRLEKAIVIVSADELSQNARFAASVRAVYALLPASDKRGRAGVKTLDVLTIDLKPIKHVEGFSFDPSRPLDPYLLYEAYGSAQMRKFFELLSLPNLKESAALVEQRNLGTKPKSRASKAALIDYMLEHVVK